MKINPAVWLLVAAASRLSVAAQPPQVEIKSDRISARIYLPDKERGFYRATRFDWSGIIFDLEFAGHHLYKPWFTSTDETVRDFVYKTDGIAVAPNSAMTGPVEEFQKPIGYDTAKPGETFLKVGVGLLRKADDTPYQFAKHFELVDGGTWTTRKTSNSITFEQVLGNAQSNYGYIYTKTLRLLGKERQLVIEHHLRNIGQLPITTVVYDHNFLTIDDKTIGTDYSITVPYDIKPNRPLDPKFVTIAGNRAEYIADLHGEDRASFNMQGFSDSPKDYDFRIVNKSAQLEVRIVGDHPLANANVWSIRNVIGVEPFINVSADPGKEFAWIYTYTYSDLSRWPR
jgi:hypothetical protein